MRELTPRQKEILEMIQDFIAETGMPPTRAEIARQRLEAERHAPSRVPRSSIHKVIISQEKINVLHQKPNTCDSWF